MKGRGKNMSEQTFLSTFADFLKANPRESFEALQPKYEALKEESRRLNEQTRREYLARLEADKSQRRLEDKQAAEHKRRAGEQDMKARHRAQFSALSDEQFERAWPRIFEDLIFAEVREREAAFRKSYQF
jgi:hypothetical protein